MSREPHSPRTRLSKDDLEDLMNIGGVKLTEDHRVKLETALQQYESQRAAFDVRHLASELAAGIERATRLIDNTREEHPGLWVTLAGARASDFDGPLVMFRDLADRSRRYGKRSKPRDLFLRKLLTTLETIFRQAGGKSTGISRGMEPRHGRFVDFANAACSHLPDFCRPEKSLASKWERIRSSRAQGEREVYISDPKRFHIVLSSNPRGGGGAR
jgi:hypothetical protein